MIKVIDGFGLKHQVASGSLYKMYSTYNTNEVVGYKFVYVVEGRAIRQECLFNTKTWAHEFQNAIDINGKVFHYEDIDKNYGSIKVMIEQDFMASMIDRNLP